ncbi:hypothetical protein JYU34_015517 [Plutella xylostella]|uniref:Uncharacterized protein n=1 Tax=Plutella xylostella TaxID=51655 RepID=A0ABQ7Q7A2_PLUXY|nr:hypothetical protein JYU34_015517 [Plutella xylostella]
MKFAVVVLALLGVACASPINPWGYGYGASIISVPSAVSVQSSVVNHGLSLPVVSKVVVPIVRPVVPVIKTVVPIVKTVVPVVSPLSYGLGYGLGGLGYGYGGYGYGGYGWGKGLGHH